MNSEEQRGYRHLSLYRICNEKEASKKGWLVFFDHNDWYFIVDLRLIKAFSGKARYSVSGIVA